jgi:wobble nucleotide-excising tRNase
MKPKLTSAIEQIKLDAATFDGTVINPTLINFFYGKNGTGKTTIAREIAADAGLTWQQGKAAADYSVLVYNQDFITANIQNYSNLPGVFTISEQNIEIQKQVAEKSRLKAEQDALFKEYSTEKRRKETESGTLRSEFQDSCWDRARTVRERFPETQTKMKKSKALFAEAVLNATTVAEHNLSSLEALYETAFGLNARTYREFQAADDSDIPDCTMLGKAVISSSDTQFAGFIKALNATDWVRHGHEQFSGASDGKCPYCQQPLPETFEGDITACFDAQYHQDIDALKQLKTAYRDAALAIHKVLKVNRDDAFPKLALGEYEAKLALFESTVKLNLQRIESKINEPASATTLDDITVFLDEINVLISQMNQQIRDNNDVVNAKQQKQAECRTKVWEYVAFLLQCEVSSYKTSKKNLEDAVTGLGRKADICRHVSKTLYDEINALNRQIVNTKATVDSINAMLRDSGFQGFSIREKAGVQSVYEVVRPNGDIAENLSEGERNFIAFLYFYHLVRGSDSADGASKDKVVVVDDPVSSMDSSVLFIVAALVRDMIEVCYNSGSYVDTKASGTYIKQILVLTHNAYFHNEVTYNQANRYQWVSFYFIGKVDNHSTIKLCTRENRTEYENYNPVQHSYAALWSEYREVQSPIPVLNVIRRILEYYFLQICRYDGTNMRKTILEINKERFIRPGDDGQLDFTQYNMAASMLSYLSTGTTGIVDGLNLIDDSMDVAQCRATFEMIFTLMNQGQHYYMMMGGEE